MFGALGKIGSKVTGWFGKKAITESAEVVTKQVTAGVAEEAAKKTARETTEKALQTVTYDTGAQIATEAAERTVTTATKTAAGEVAEAAAKTGTKAATTHVAPAAAGNITINTQKSAGRWAADKATGAAGWAFDKGYKNKGKIIIAASVYDCGTNDCEYTMLALGKGKEILGKAWDNLAKEMGLSGSEEIRVVTDKDGNLVTNKEGHVVTLAVDEKTGNTTEVSTGQTPEEFIKNQEQARKTPVEKIVDFFSEHKGKMGIGAAVAAGLSVLFGGGGGMLGSLGNMAGTLFTVLAVAVVAVVAGPAIMDMFKGGESQDKQQARGHGRERSLDGPDGHEQSRARDGSSEMKVQEIADAAMQRAREEAIGKVDPLPSTKGLKPVDLAKGGEQDKARDSKRGAVPNTPA